MYLKDIFPCGKLFWRLTGVILQAFFKPHKKLVRAPPANPPFLHSLAFSEQIEQQGSHGLYGCGMIKKQNVGLSQWEDDEDDVPDVYEQS